MTEPVFFTVEADLRAVVADLPTDSDYDGQQAPVSAVVTISPQINRGDIILATNATPRPVGYIPASVSAVVDAADGRLKLRSTTDAGATGFTFAPVRLLANSALLELDPATPLIYKVEFSQVTFFGRPGIIKPIFFEAPTTDVTINLIESGFSQPGQPPTGITKIAPTGVRFADGNLIFSFAGVDLDEPLPISEFTGPQGDAATIAVGDVTTLAYDQPATITNSGTAGDAVFDFAIPEGEPATVTVGDVSTLTPEDDATVTNTGTERNAVLDFGIPKGDAATVTVGTVSTVAPGDPATVTNTGTSGDAVLDFGLPQGEAATIAVGTVTTGQPGDPVTVTNTGDANAAVFDFDIPQGAAATITIGDVTTGAPGDPATVTNSGTTADAVLDFDIPQGDKGDAATITVGTTTTLSPGADATVTNSGNSSAAVFDFGLPEGIQGATGPKGDAASLAVGTVTTVSPTSSASVTNVGTSTAAVFNFSIPKGDTGSADATEWGSIPGQPAVIAAGATEAAARDAIDAEYTGARGVALGIATLDAAGKVPYSQLPASLMSYIGTWSAATNTPTLADGVGDTGDTYRVTASGTVNLGSGSIEFTTGDYVILNQAGVWEKSDGTDSVSSVAGKTGTVTLTKSDVGLSNVDNTSDASKPISTATQTALDGKEPTITTGASGQYWDGNKTFQTLNKSAVGLGNVDNTTDLGKPISTATQAALDAKEPTVTGGTTAQYYRGDKAWATLDKTAVGLSNVDNTSDASKPISTATATALSGKEPTIASGTAGQYYRGDKVFATLDKTAVGLSNVNNTADADKPISTATASALAGKEPTITAGASGQYWTGAKTFATLDKNAVGLGNVDNTSDATKNAASAVLTNKTISGANNTVTNLGVAAIGASGTPSSTTFLRGDNSWQTVSGGITRSVQTITAPTTLGAAANTDYVYFLSSTPSTGDQYLADTLTLLHLDGANGSTTFTCTAPTPKTWTATGSPSLATAQKRFGTASLSVSGGARISATTAGFAFGTNDYTIEAFVYIPTLTGAPWSVMASRTSASTVSGQWSLYVLADGTVGFYDTSAIESGTTKVAAGAWYHIAVTRASGTQRMFINGTLVGSRTNTMAYNTTTIWIGGLGNAAEYFNGFVDEVRITSACRYTASFTAPTQQFSESAFVAGSTGTPTLPTAIGNNTSQYTLRNVSSDPIAVATTSGQTIDINGIDPFASSVALLLNGNGANGSTSFIDSSSSPKTITRLGTPTISTAQYKFGGASMLFGNNGIQIANPQTAFIGPWSGDFTIEAWTYPTTAPTSQGSGAERQIAGQLDWPSNTNSWFFYYDQNRLAFLVGDGSGYDMPSATLSSNWVANMWYHVAVCRSGSTIRLYQNGTLVGSGTSTKPIFVNNTLPLTIGTDTGGNTCYLPGYLDDLRITAAARYTEPFFIPPTSEMAVVLPQSISLDRGSTVRLISDASNWRSV